MAGAVFAPGGNLVCNVAAKQLGEFLAQHDTEEVAGWALDNEDMAAKLPDDFRLPKGILGRISAAAVRNLHRRTPDGRCPAWDTILQDMHDAAELALRNAAQGGYADDPRYAQDMLSLRRVRACAALLARPDLRDWYYRQMDALQPRILDRLAGVAVGGEAAGTVEPEQDGADAADDAGGDPEEAGPGS